MELDSENTSSDKLPPPAPIKDLEAQKKTSGPTINKLTGLRVLPLPLGWKKEIWHRGDIVVKSPDGFVFRRKSQLRKYCECWPIQAMGINPDEVFKAEIIPKGTKQVGQNGLDLQAKV